MANFAGFVRGGQNGASRQSFKEHLTKPGLVPESDKNAQQTRFGKDVCPGFCQVL